MNLIQTLREAGNDYRADTGEDLPDEVAYELAACTLQDPAMLKEAKRLWPGKSKQVLQEIMADYI
jgi:hypothetical protein